MATDALTARFREWLRERELPVTAQRLAIADVLFDAPGHLSADEVASALATRGTKAGTATVYRTLDVLVESGLVVERDFGEGFRRFEAAREAPRHEHLLCTQCGQVEEFQDDALEQVTARAAEARGFTRSRHRLVIYGICAECGTTTKEPVPHRKIPADG